MSNQFPTPLRQSELAPAPQNQSETNSVVSEKKSKKPFITIILVIIALLVGAVAGFFIAKKFFPTVVTKTVTVKDNTPTENFPKTLIVYEADIDNPTQEQMDSVAAIMRTRLDSAGYPEAFVSLQGSKQVRIEIPTIDIPDDVTHILGATAQLEFWNANGEVVLTGADIETASAEYGQVSELGASEHYVELKLTQEGIRKFSEATAVAAAAPEGQNYIAIMMDGVMLSAPRVQEQITSDTCIFSGEFDAEMANELASQINAGQLPFSLLLRERSILCK